MKLKLSKGLPFLLIIGMSIAFVLTGCGNNVKSNVPANKSGDSTSAAKEGKPPEKVVPKEKSSLKLSFSKNSGVYEEKFNLEITSDGKAEIYYTTDGSNPITSTTRKLYKAPVKIVDRRNDKNYVSAVDPFLFDAANVDVNSSGNGFVSKLDSKPADNAVDKCTVIRATALDQIGLYSRVTTNTYFIGSIAKHIKGIEESCKAAGTELAVISLSINYNDLFDPKTGIYVKGDIYDKSLQDFLTTGEQIKPDTSRRLEANYTQRGKEWERNVHMDFFESNGVTTNLDLQQDCGIRIQGNYSRSDLNKGFRLFARKEYGNDSFDYAFFGNELKNDAGETMKEYKSLTLRSGGNCAFTTKYSDTYWQSLVKKLKCDTQTSRPCIVYINGEYWGLYVLQEDYSRDYFAYKHGVNKDDIVSYKGDAEKYEMGYKLDLGKLPDGVTNESYYFNDLWDFFNNHKDLSKTSDYEDFTKLVDVDSVRDYFAVQIWINNKWDWPGKNWSLWKTVKVDKNNPYADGRWRFCFYDVEFGGVMGRNDIAVNTIKEDNYKPAGLLDRDTKNPAVLTFIYLMSNKNFRNDFENSLKALSSNNFQKDKAIAALDVFKNTYSPLYDQFFARYPGAGSTDNSNNGGYASYQCIKDFLGQRADYIQPMIDYINN